MKELFEKMAAALIAGNQDEVIALTREGLDKKVAPRDILDKGLLVGMDVVGQRFKAGEMFIPEVLLCARCMHAAMDILNPLLSKGDAAGAGTVVIGTVEGDLHDIGKNLVAMMLQGAGFKIIDLGTDIKPRDFVLAIEQHQPDILGMSALLTTTMPKMQETIEALKTGGLRNQVKVMIGGAPVTQEYADRIGADAYSANAASATEKARQLSQ